ncbi:MAG: hypothetical protein ACRDRS_26215, partial [Pseudonocardiaceae bacterium]
MEVAVEAPSGGGSLGGGKRRPGRPPKITDPASSAAAALGAELRRLRIERELTLGLDDLDWARLVDATRRPSRLSTAVVDDLELITDRQRRLYHELSSAEMLMHVQAHGGLLMSLVDCRPPRSWDRRERIFATRMGPLGCQWWDHPACRAVEVDR